MSVDAQTARRDIAPAGAVDGPDTAGQWLARLSVLPTLVVMAWLLVGLPLLLAGQFKQTFVLVLWLPLAVALGVFGLRSIPAPRLPARPSPDTARSPARRTPWWTVAALLAVAIAFGVQQMIYHSEQIIVMRDPASYIQFGSWIAHHGSLPILQHRGAFGGARAFGGSQQVLSFGTPAFYQVGGVIIPQFMAGLPMLLAAGYWFGGVGAALAAAPLLGACGVLAIGGLAARLVGPRWAPVAALVLALALPEQFTSRSTYSETLAQILFIGGLCLIIDSLGADGAASRVTAGLGGLALGLGVLARIDGLSDILPVIPYCGLLFISRRRLAIPLIGGLALGTGYGLVDGLVLSKPYLTNIQSSLRPLELADLAVIALTAVAVAGVLWLWRAGRPKSSPRWLANAAVLLPIAITAGFTIRPFIQTVRRQAPSAASVARYQLADHLPIDPTRTYAEISLHWVVWYVGIPAVVLATLAAAVLLRRCLLGQAQAWTLPLLAFGWIIVTCLYRPAITPDHPWASRRLVPVVLPAFIVLAVWAAGWLVDRIRQRGWGAVACGALASCCVLALLLPTATTTFGLRLQRGGPVGVRLAAEGLAFKPTYRGEVSAVDHLCAAIPGGSSVVIISPLVGSQFAEVIRGMCGDPAALIDTDRYRTVAAIVRIIERAGRRPVLLAAWPARLRGFGAPVRHIVDLRTRADEHTLTTAPLNTEPYSASIWMTEPHLPAAPAFSRSVQ